MTACPDWRERLRAGVPPVAEGLVRDPELADRAERIFGMLRLPDVPGKPRLADSAGRWFVDAVVRPIFGSLDRDTGRRAIREVLVLVPKKNSKTTNGAGLMTTAAMMSPRDNVELTYLAPTVEIARSAYDQALGMVQADAGLMRRWYPREHARELIYRPKAVTQKIKTFDPKSTTGMRCPFGLGDELHVMASFANADRVVRQALGGLDPFPDGCWVWITTQSERPPAGVFAEKLAYARAVRDGEVDDPSFLPVLYEMPDDEDWRDQACWHLVNPNLGRSQSLTNLEAGFRKADEAGEHDLRGWASQYLNVEIGVMLRVDGWAAADYWPDAVDPELVGLDALIERSEVVVLGVDPGGADDLQAVCVVGRERGTQRLLVWFRAWCLAKVLERYREIAPALYGFADDGDLELSDDVDAIDEAVCDLADDLLAKGVLHSLWIDVETAKGIHRRLQARGFPAMTVDGKPMVQGVKQGGWLHPYIAGVPRELAGGRMVHGGQRLAAWAVGNTRVKRTGNLSAIDKGESGAAKIDPVAALLCAMRGMDDDPPAVGGRSFWEAA